MSADFSDPARGENETAIAHEAARWLARRDRGLTPLEETQLRQWCAADPRHAAELARLEVEWQEFNIARASPTLVAMAAAVEQSAQRRLRHKRTVWGLSLAAAAAVALSFVLLRPAGDRAARVESYQVLASAAKRVPFEDGSVAMVRDDSDVRAEYTETERRVVLVRGEAHFTVEKDPARPFIVSAGRARVRAVGTAFNVRLEPQRIEVIVTEGTVQIDDLQRPALDDVAPRVEAGQRAVIEQELEAQHPIAVAPTAATELEQVLAWQDTRLAFARTPLADAVEAFNRHAPAGSPRLVIGDSSLQTRQMGGTFRASNVEAFVRLLERSPDIRVERHDGEILLLPAR